MESTFYDHNVNMLMKTIQPFIKGLLIMSLFLTLLNVATMFIPTTGALPMLSRVMDVALFTTFVLTVLGIFHTVFYLLEDDSLLKLTPMGVFYLMIPLINVLGILLFLHLFLVELGSKAGL